MKKSIIIILVCCLCVTSIASAGSAPVADFIADNTNPCIGDTVTFSDLSTNTPTAWHWIVTGGWDSHVQNPTHIFDTEGPFSVNLTVSNAYGGDYELKPDYINIINCTPPAPTPIPNPIRQNKGQNIDLLTWIYNMFRSKLV